MRGATFKSQKLRTKNKKSFWLNTLIVILSGQNLKFYVFDEKDQVKVKNTSHFLGTLVELAFAE